MKKYLLLIAAFASIAKNDYGYTFGLTHFQMSHPKYKVTEHSEGLYSPKKLVAEIDEIESTDQASGVMGGLYYTSDLTDETDFLSNYEIHLLSDSSVINRVGLGLSAGLGFKKSKTVFAIPLLFTLSHKYGFSETSTHDVSAGLTTGLSFHADNYTTSLKLNMTNAHIESEHQKKLANKIMTSGIGSKEYRITNNQSTKDEHIEALNAHGTHFATISLNINYSLSDEDDA